VTKSIEHSQGNDTILKIKTTSKKQAANDENPSENINLFSVFN